MIVFQPDGRTAEVQKDSMNQLILPMSSSPVKATVSITVNPQDAGYCPESMTQAIALASHLLLSKQYFKVIGNLFPQLSEDIVKPFLTGNSFVVNVFHGSTEHSDSYAFVVPESYTINFNSVMLKSMKKRTDSKSGKKRPAEERNVLKQTVFLVVKIVHYISHLMNIHCHLNTVTLPETQMIINNTPLDNIDIGDMVEAVLFGGIASHQGTRMDLDCYVSSKTKHAAVGIRVRPNSKIEKISCPEDVDMLFSKKRFHWYVTDTFATPYAGEKQKVK